jgi:hypothetical protein
MPAHFNRKELEELRTRKQGRPALRLTSSTVVEHEYRRCSGHLSYAFVKFECAPAKELSLDVVAQWPSTVPEEYRSLLELAIAEGVADVLLDGLHQHTGCAVTLVKIGYNEIESSEHAFMMASRRSMEDLLKAEWTA